MITLNSFNFFLFKDVALKYMSFNVFPVVGFVLFDFVLFVDLVDGFAVVVGFVLFVDLVDVFVVASVVVSFMLI